MILHAIQYTQENEISILVQSRMGTENVFVNNRLYCPLGQRERFKSQHWAKYTFTLEVRLSLRCKTEVLICV